VALGGDVSIFGGVLVTFGTVGDGFPLPAKVLFLGHGFEVMRVDAVAHPAQVVYLVLIRDLADALFIAPPVCV
jgi:hypothetical protein